MIARLQLPSLAYKSLMLIYFCPLKQCGNIWGLCHWGSLLSRQDEEHVALSKQGSPES